MNKREVERLENVARDWAKRAYRSEQERIAFVVGVLAVVDTQDGITAEQAKSINARLTHIVWHEG